MTLANIETLTAAVVDNDVAMVTALLRVRPDLIKQRISPGMVNNGTLLHLAASYGHPKLVHRLIQAGCSITDTDDDNWSPMTFLIDFQRSAIGSQVKDGEECFSHFMNAVRSHGEEERRQAFLSWLSDAATSTSVQAGWAFQLLDEGGMDPFDVHSTPNGNLMLPALALIKKNRRWEHVEEILRRARIKSDVSALDTACPTEVDTLLTWSIRVKDPELLRALLSEGASPTAPNHDGATPLDVLDVLSHDATVEEMRAELSTRILEKEMPAQCQPSHGGMEL